MNILVTRANGQLGNEMRINSKGTSYKYIFTDVNQVEGVETVYLDITDLDAIRKMVKENGVKAGVTSQYGPTLIGQRFDKRKDAFLVIAYGING